MVYVGVDLHRKTSHVAVLDGDGEVLASRRIPSLKGTQTPDRTSSSNVILMDETTQDLAGSNGCALGRPWSWIRPRVRRLEHETSVGPSPVVPA